MNNTEPLNKTSLLAKLINSRPEHIQEYLRINGADSPPVAPGDVELVSGKMEYFVMGKLLSGMVPLKHQSPSPLRKQLFNVVKLINLTKFQSSTSGKDDTSEKLYTLNYCDLYWAKFDLIFKRINKGQTNIIPIPVIQAELAALKKMGVIECKKFRDRDEYGYLILTLSVDDGLKFPEIKDLFGECPEDQLREVMSPITGIMEKI